MVVYYFAYGKKHGVDLTDIGVRMPARKLVRGILLGLLVAAAGIACVFAEDFFFKSDFRLWTLAFKAFDAPILKYWPYMEKLRILTGKVCDPSHTSVTFLPSLGSKWVTFPAIA